MGFSIVRDLASRRGLSLPFVLVLVLVLGGPGCTHERPPSVLLVTIDTARADAFGAYGGRAHTPTFDALARDGVLFETALTPVPITHPAHTSLLTGAYPARHGVRDNGLYTLDEGAVTLAELLRERGYATAAFVSAVVLTRSFGLAQGFDRYDDADLSGQHLERRAKDTIDAAVAGLRTSPRDRPFFCWVHLYDPHYPYEPPEPYASQWKDAPYLGEVSYADAEVARLIDAARTLDPRTLVVVTADHGEGLGEHGEATHGIFLYQSTLHVPLVMAGGPLPSGVRVSGVVSLLDVLPTICEVSGATPPSPLDGQSLLPAIARRDAGSRDLLIETMLPYLSYGWSALHGIVQSELKTIAAPRPELYDLRSDPHELHDLAPERGGEIQRRIAALAARAAAIMPSSARPLSASQDVQGALGKLGYVSTPRRIDGRETAGPDPKDMVILLDWEAQAQFLMQQSKWQEAAAILERLLQRSPDHAIAKEMLGSALTRLGQYDRARSILEQALAQRPDRPMTVFHLALCNEMSGQVDRARELYASTIALDDRFPPAHLRLANILWAQGRQDDARVHYRRYLELAPGDPEREAAVRERLESSR